MLVALITLHSIRITKDLDNLRLHHQMALLRKRDPAVSRNSDILLCRLMQLVVEEGCKVREGQVQLCVAEAVPT